MRKILSFVAAMLVAFAANAAVVNITPTSPRTQDNIRYALRDSVSADTILLAAGTYTEANSIEANRDIVIMAADGAKPVVQLASGAYIKVLNAANVVVKGLDFDGAANSTQYAIRPYDASASSITVQDCEFHGFTKNIITCDGTNHTNSLVINGCYFHDNTRAAVYFAASTAEGNVDCCDYLYVANTTIANVSALSGAGAIDIRNNGSNVTGSTAQLIVEHCTFYNILGYERVVQSYKSPRVSIKDCIFMQPTAQDNYATWAYGGEVKNCIAYNFQNSGHHDWDACPTFTDTLKVDPQFVDAANLDLHLALTSPAIGAGSDGSTLGDPRWWPVIGAPEYYLVGTMNNWTPAEAYKFVANPSNEAEYMLTTALAEGDSLKVLEIVGNTQTWYPDNAPNYAVDANHAGTAKEIYFRPDGQGGNDWYYHVLYIAENPAPVDPYAPYTLYFNCYNKTDGDKSAAETKLSGLFAEASLAYIDTAAAKTLTNVYLGRKYKEGNDSIFSNVKFGTSKAGGTLKFALKDMNVDSIIFRAAKYSDSEGGDGFTVNGTALTLSKGNKKFENVKYVPASAITTLEIVQGKASSGRFYMTSITVYPKKPAPEVKYSLKNNWGAGEEWTWKEMTKDGNNYKLENVVFGGTGVNYKADLLGAPEIWVPDSMILGDKIAAKDTVTFVLNPADSTITATLIGKYVEPVTGCDWANIAWVEGEPANQYKVCKETAYPGVVNIQQPGWAAEKGIYMTFENDVFGTFSLDSSKYAIEGAGVVFYLSAFTAKETEVTVQNNNAVVTFTVYNENGTEPQPEVNYSLKNNWGAGEEWTWKEMTKDGNNYKLENVVFGGTGVNYKADLLGAPEIWVPDSMILGDKIAAKDTVTFVLNPADSTITATLIGKYVEPAPVPEWAVIKFNQVVPKDSLAADASFVLLGSDFKAQITDTDNKMEIDANACRFGSAEGYDMFSHRLKTGGKSSATKSYITVSIPETGKLAIAVRTGSNSATDRNLVVKQGNDTLYNQIILESQAIKVMEDTTEVSVYPYIMLPVDSGTVVLSYPVGALNFYAFAFKKEQPIIGPEYYLVGNMNDWKAAEGYKFAANPAAEGEYMLTTTLALGNEFKVLGTGSIENTWYPDNAGNYVVTADYVGEKTIYFRPAGNPDWEGFHAGGYFYMEANPAPAGKITCDSVYNLAKGDTVALAPLTVTYANGKNLYVKDATGAMLVYLGANGTWKAGDVLSNVEGVLDIYNGLYEVKTDTNQMKAITAVEGPVPAPEELDTIRLADVNKYIKILAIQVAADTAIHSTGKATNIDIIFDEDTIVLRNNFLLEYAFEAGKKYDITGVISYYVAKGASVGTLQVFPTAIEEQQIIGAPEYYLAGSMNGWAANADYKFAENPAKEGEYMLTTALALNDEFKVIGVVGATTTWYPTGMGNNYKVDADHAGAAKTIYFNPNGGQEGWYEGYFYVEPNVVPMENPIDTVKFFMMDDSWSKDTLSTVAWDAENQKVVINNIPAKNGQWRAQLWLKLPMEVKVDKEYDLAFKIKTNKTFEGTIVKYQENAEMLIDWNLALTADVETVYEKKNMPGVLANGGVTGNGVLCIDFGFAPAETHIEIYEIAIVEHDPTTAPAKFYVTGNDAFTVDAGLTTADSWNSKAFKSESDTMTFALKAGAAYQLKVCVDGTWSTVKGYNDLTEVTPGIIDADGGNHNIGFSLVEDGDVMVIYTGEVFKVVGNFVTQGLNDIDASVKAVKVLRNGQIFILRGDKVYTVTGQPVK